MPRSASPAGGDPEGRHEAEGDGGRRKSEVATEDRRESRRGGDRIVFDGPKRTSEAAGKSLDDRVKDNQAERRQRDGDRRRIDASPDRRSRRPERRLEDDDRGAPRVRGMYSDRSSGRDRDRGYNDVRGRERYERRSSPDGRYGGRDRADLRENGRKADRDRDAPRSRAEANGRKDAEEPATAEKPAPAEKPAGKAGGVYIPPFKLAQMLREAKDETSAQYQRLRWDALRKSVNGLINKVNKENIKAVLPEIFGENLVRGRGLLCRSLMKSQMASPTFTPIFAALVSVINTKFPEIGELLLHRLILQFKRAFKRNDKPICLAVSLFIAHLVNQQVADDMLSIEVAILLLDNPSEDSVEIALEFFKACGAYLQDVNKAGFDSVLTRMRAIIAQGVLEKRTALLIQNFLEQVASGGRAAAGSLEKLGYAPVPDGLDLIEAGDQITHQVSLEDSYNPKIALDVFKEDPDFQQSEKEYEAIKREILGEDSEDEDDDDDEDDDEDEDDSDEEPAAAQAPAGAPMQRIQDNTETNLINLRRTIYLTIMSGLTFEETGHKLMKIELGPGQEFEVASMIMECCANEKTFSKYHALLATRFAMKEPAYQECFEDCFRRQYTMIHRLETNKLRNVAKFFAALLEQDAISWAVMDTIRLTQDDTTSSSRIFIKILFQELSENMGLIKLNQRLQDPQLAEWFAGIFPRDTPKNMRFSINFFTSIGLGGLTDALREHLAALPKLLAEQRAAQAAAQQSSSDPSSSESDSSSSSDDSDSSSSSGNDSSSSDSSSDDSSSSSDSDSDEPPPKKAKGGAREPAQPAARKQEASPQPPPRLSRREDASERREWDGRRDARTAALRGRHEEAERRDRRRSPARQTDDRRKGEQERKRSREDGAPSENGDTRKRRAAEEAQAGRSSKGSGQATGKRRNDSRESSHERWVGANAEPVDVNDRWAG